MTSILTRLDPDITSRAGNAYKMSVAASALARPTTSYRPNFSLPPQITPSYLPLHPKLSFNLLTLSTASITLAIASSGCIALPLLAGRPANPTNRRYIPRRSCPSFALALTLGSGSKPQLRHFLYDTPMLGIRLTVAITRYPTPTRCFTPLQKPRRGRLCLICAALVLGRNRFRHDISIPTLSITSTLIIRPAFHLDRNRGN